MDEPWLFLLRRRSDPVRDLAEAARLLRADSGRKMRTEREVRGSMWMSLVATPSVNKGFGGETDSSGRVVTPNGSDEDEMESDWIRFCRRCFKRNLKKTL